MLLVFVCKETGFMKGLKSVVGIERWFNIFHDHVAAGLGGLNLQHSAYQTIWDLIGLFSLAKKYEKKSFNKLSWPIKSHLYLQCLPSSLYLDMYGNTLN